MIIEKLIFNILSFVLLGYVFWKLISKNDTNYVYVLIIQAIGIVLNFIEILASIEYSIFLKIIMYIISIIILLISLKIFNTILPINNENRLIQIINIIVSGVISGGTYLIINLKYIKEILPDKLLKKLKIANKNFL